MRPVPCDASSPEEGAGLLRIRKLSVNYASRGQAPVHALRQLDLEISAGEVVGILGESGCGKSTLALSILGLLPAGARTDGSILFRDEEVLGLMEPRLRRIRGARISLIHQEPRLALSPVMRVGEQIAEVIRAHRRLARRARKQEAETMLKEVQLTDTKRIYSAYPHQLSGGELHRVAIAQALACHPDLLIADEPTRSLDTTIQAEILELLRTLRQRFGTALIFITHNPALLLGFADSVLVMYAGRVVEAGSLSTIFGQPLHPYTRCLLDLMPRSPLRGDLAGDHLRDLPGGPPDSQRRSVGCAFEPRCSRRTQICLSEYPEELMPESDHRVSCFNHGS